MKEAIHYVVFFTALISVVSAIDEISDIRKEKKEIRDARAAKDEYGLGWSVAKACYASHARGNLIATVVLVHFLFVVIQQISERF